MGHACRLSNVAERDALDGSHTPRPLVFRFPLSGHAAHSLLFLCRPVSKSIRFTGLSPHHQPGTATRARQRQNATGGS